MKWGMTEAEQSTANAAWKAAASEWHPWFAWHPVRLGSGRWCWLETIEARIGYYRPGEDFMEPVWEYRARD